MNKYMLIASILALSGCLTTPEISEPGRSATTAAPATTGGETTTTETPGHAQHTVDNTTEDQSKPRSARAERATGQTDDAEMANIEAWIDDACPRGLGPAIWSRCVQRERAAVNAGLPTTDGLPTDIRAWIDDACPRGLGPAIWSRCVQRERTAVNAGLPTTDGLPADIRAWIHEACPRGLGPAIWSRCIRRELNAVSAGLPTRGSSSGDRAHATPGSKTEKRTAERATPPASTQATSGETDEHVAEVPPEPPKDPAPHLPKPENGERWLCGDAWDMLFPTMGEPIIVLTRESPRDQATGTGKIAVGGVTHESHFKIEGISRRWDWNFNDEENGALDTFVINGDGSGAYYDFRGVKGSTGPSEILECMQG